ncbi:MAG: hypothetical protein ACPKPY_10970 [Nitrososphaeraceae archaeon]
MHNNYKFNRSFSISYLHISFLAFLLSVIGSLLQISGGSWDVTSHLLNEPESFFTPSHTLLYSGIGLMSLSAMIGFVLSIYKKQEIKSKSFLMAFKLLIFGSILSVSAGPLDFLWHDIFGFDGLLSPTHIILVTGMLVNAIGSLIGIYRISIYFNYNSILRTILIAIAFSSLWYTSIWYVFMFVLPFSETDFFDFNLNIYVATFIASLLLPLINSIIFITASKVLGNFFSSGLIVASIVIFINTLSNILPANDLLIGILPWYLFTVLGFILISDITLNTKFLKQRFSTKTSILVSGAILGSVFYLFNYPMLTWTFGSVLNTYLVSINGVLPTFINTLPIVSLITICIGALLGLLGGLLYIKKIQYWFDTN